MKAFGGFLLAAPLCAMPMLIGCGAMTYKVPQNQPSTTTSGSGGSGTSSGSGGSGTSGGSGGSGGSSGTGGSGTSSGSSGSGSSTSGASIPANAIALSGIQALSGWLAITDTGAASGSAQGATEIVGQPSKSGSARQFTTTFSNDGDERYDVLFGADTQASNFVYDGWIYIGSPAADVGNLEMDLNQVMANGETVLFGFQCDGYSGTWDYTENAGTAQSPTDAWVHSGAACNPRTWTADAWHHVQISYARDDAGNVTYNSVWLDGTEQTINATVPSAFALGWSSSLVTNFQVDGVGSGGSSTVYLDDLTVYRW
ncbi:MAG: hypothetical protein WBY75_19635 [Terracidiphilus sp.]